MAKIPARLTAEQAAWVLNYQVHDVPALVAARLIKPLGNPPPNGIKFFSTTDILELTKDRNWLVRISSTICQHWQKKNTGKKNRPLLSATNGPSSEFNLPMPMAS